MCTSNFIIAVLTQKVHITTAAEHAALILYRPLQILRCIELLLNFISFTKHSNNRRNENEFNQLTLYFTLQVHSQ